MKQQWEPPELGEMQVVILSLHQKWWQNIHNYAAGSRNKVYGWEVADVKEYPRAVTLEELGIKRAPQSWQYMR